MLGKLIKHEWKAIGKFLLAMVIFNLAITFVGVVGVLFSPDIFSGNMNEISPIYTLLIVTYISTYLLGMMAVFFGSMIYLGTRFYRSMYGVEGYLTHTLPATPLQLITAKTIVASLMLIINSLLLFLSGCALLFSIAASSGMPIPPLREMMRTLTYAANNNIPVIGYILLYCLMILVSLINNILMIYAATSLGQLFNKHRILGAVGIYFGLSLVSQIIMTIFMFASIGLANNFNNARQAYDGVVIPTFAISTIIMAILGAIYFLLTYLITKKKLNLE